MFWLDMSPTVAAVRENVVLDSILYIQMNGKQQNGSPFRIGHRAILFKG